MRSYRLVGLLLTALLLVGGMAVSVVAISTTSHVEPSTPHMVQRTPAISPDDVPVDDVDFASSSPHRDTDD